MELQKTVVKKLLLLYRSCVDRTEELESMGVSLSFVDNEKLWNIALDLIGFPEDNSREFDFMALNGHEPEGKRVDIDNLFSRDWLMDHSFMDHCREEPNDTTVDEYMEFLYEEYNKMNAGMKPEIDLSKFKDISLN